MLLAHPAVLNGLLAEYDSLRVLDAEHSGPDVQRRLLDVSYSLCLATGTSDIDAALIAARNGLPGARPEDDSAIG
ncbi:DUF5133 domain-containing protein [Streptomyces sp. NPDC005538]|uniref:DUF5133 domain-containing protein n=1 Tax=unclassified Streptomyces TaxID=2593676 RepID=UPI0033BD1BBB